MLLLLACAAPGRISIAADADVSAAIQSTVDHLPWDDVSLNTPDPTIELRTDGEGEGCYTIEGGDRWIVHGGDLLGAQYGLAAILEGFGFRFLHPTDTFAPAELGDGVTVGESACPAMARRGLHLHTLHPIEALAAFWSDDDPDRAEQVMDWVVHNGGNHLQWVALDEMDPAWATRTANLVDEAHARGLTTGIGVQLFGSSNLQLAFDLVDGDVDDAEMQERLHTLSDGIDWDHYSLSFGEFSGTDPETFIDATNRASAAMAAVKPTATVSATIHVGNFDDLRVEYDDQEMLYYFLVQYADPRIIPWIHSVMFYTLYATAGGAYNHEHFDEHRAFLEARIAAGEPVGYHPETAYWVAFDDSVPLYLPLYMKSRAMDLFRAEGLEDQVTFSTGWEWGYWQNDRSVLRMGYDGGADWDAQVRQMYAPIDPAIGEAVIALAEEQQEALLNEALTPWMASRDNIMDVGRGMGILSQPDRPAVETVAAYDEAERAAFRATVIDPLLAHAERVEAIAQPSGTPWADEVRDGLQIDAARARFAAAIWEAVLVDADPDAFSRADAALSEAEGIVARRHAALHDQDDRWIAASWDNATIYDYGYLGNANDLCFWRRERILARNLILGETGTDPGCAL